MRLVYIGSLDDSVYRNPWNGIPASNFIEVILRQVLTSDPIGINDGYIFQSAWAIQDLMKEDRSLLLRLARAGFLKVLCRTKSFQDMPERMSGIVETHTALMNRPDYQDIKNAASQFGKGVLECNAYASWPTIDIGYGFYLLCVAAYRMIRDTRSVSEWGLAGVPRTMTLSALSEIIRTFHDNPISIRGKLESEVIPKIIAEYRCTDHIASEFRTALMGLANEFYHINYAALLAAEDSPDHGYSGVSVETRSSHLFRGILENGTLPQIIDASELRTVLDLDVPAIIGEDKIDAVMDFVTHGKGAYEAKKQFLEKEDRLFRDDKKAVGERQAGVNELNNAIYDTLYGSRDQARVRPVNRTLNMASEYTTPLLELTERLMSYIGVDIYTGPGAEEAVESTLISLDVTVPSVVRRLGTLTSTYPKVARPDASTRSSSLLSVGLSAQPCTRFRAVTSKTIDEFATRFPIDNSELVVSPFDE